MNIIDLFVELSSFDSVPCMYIHLPAHWHRTWIDASTYLSTSSQNLYNIASSVGLGTLMCDIRRQYLVRRPSRSNRTSVILVVGCFIEALACTNLDSCSPIPDLLFSSTVWWKPSTMSKQVPIRCRSLSWPYLSVLELVRRHLYCSHMSFLIWYLGCFVT